MWHHFDPPWRERQHHDPAGMVALCRDHHPEADVGAFSRSQLRAFKTAARDGTTRLGAQFNWMRQSIVAVVGGNFFVGCSIAVQVQDHPVVWFNRDQAGNVLVNVQQLSTAAEPRMLMVDNFWMTEGKGAEDIECPPSGRLVKARYANGDRIGVEFQSHESWDEFEKRFNTERPPPPPQMPEFMLADLEPEDRERLLTRTGIAEDLPLPLTTVAVSMKIAGTNIEFGARNSKIAGNLLKGSWMRGPGTTHGGSVGLQIGPVSG
jgi:hypothetical protein